MQKLFTNKETLIFILCTGLAFIFWLFSALSRSYTHVFPFSVNYSNIPDKKILIHFSDKEIWATTQASGWEVLANQLNIGPATINIDLSNYQGRSYLLARNKIGEVNKQLGEKFKVLSLKPDTIFFSLDEITEKKLPIRLNKDIKLKKQFDIAGEIEIKPDSILVQGGKSILTKIHYWETDTLTQQEVIDNINTSISLKEMQGVQLSRKKVEVSIPIEEHTEGIIEIPISIVNAPENNKVAVFPKKIKVYYLVPLSKYEQVNQSMFKSSVDYNQIQQERAELLVSLTPNTELLKNIRYHPKMVEYLVYE